MPALLIYWDYFQVASFPFSDHNCPPIQLIASFCQSAHSWLKEDIQNVVVVHCKAGLGRTGLMICSLLLFLKVSLENWLQILEYLKFSVDLHFFLSMNCAILKVNTRWELFCSSSPLLRKPLITLTRKDV
jgi:hypothetical protein